MTPERRTVDTLDVPLPANRTLRLALTRGPDGEPERLALALGWGAGREWREDRSEGIELPAEILPDLRAALDRLAHTT